MEMYRVYRWIDGCKGELAAIFEDLAKAEAYVRDNNAQSGGHTYGIDPADLPEEGEEDN